MIRHSTRHSPRVVPRAVAASLVLLLLLACAGDGGGPAAPPLPGSIENASIGALTGRIGDTVAVAVRVMSTDGRMVAGYPVLFSAAPGSGTVLAPSATTDAGGVARTAWILGTTVGSQQIVARAGELSAVTIGAVVSAGRASSIAVSAGDDQRAEAGSDVATRPAVVVRDAAGNPVAGARVVFAVESGGGRVTGDTTTADASGIATATAWRLGTTIAANTLRAYLAGGSAAAGVVFRATTVAGGPRTLTFVSRPADTLTVGTALDLDSLPVVRVTDAFGNAVPGTPVTFSVVSGDQSATGVATTDTDGRVRALRFTLDTVVGSTVVSATAGVATASVTIVRRAGLASTFAVVSGGGQTPALGEPLAPIVLRIVDRYRNVVAGARVIAWNSATVTVPDTVAISDAQGIVRFAGITATRTGSLAVRISSPGAFDNGVSFAVPPLAPAQINWDPNIELFSGVLDRSRRSRPFQVRVVDRFGTGISGLPVKFTLTPAAEASLATLTSAGVGSTLSVLTDSIGYAWVVVEAGPNFVPLAIDATVPSLPVAQLHLYIGR